MKQPWDIVEEILPMLEPSFRENLEGQHNEAKHRRQPLNWDPRNSICSTESPIEPISLDELITQGSYSSSEVMSILLSLEMKGLIKQIPGLQYIRMTNR